MPVALQSTDLERSSIEFAVTGQEDGDVLMMTANKLAGFRMSVDYGPS